MPAETACNWWFGGPAMKRVWARLRWNLNPKNLFSRKPNPYTLEDKGKERPAWKDLSHSLVDVPVEYARACPYRMGHLWVWEHMAIIAAGILVWILH